MLLISGTSSNKPAREQISGVIIAEKPRGELFGVLLSKKVYISDKTSGVRC